MSFLEMMTLRKRAKIIGLVKIMGIYPWSG